MRDEPAKSLPYGDQRRLEIVRALATRPKLLLLDEPAAGMNPSEKVELMKLDPVHQGQIQIAVLLVEHDMQVVMGICQRIAVLDYGVKIAEGTPAEVRSEPEGDRGLSGRRGSRRLRCLEIKNLVVNYGAITALHGISLKVQQGDIVTLIGANGAGKTTTLARHFRPAQSAQRRDPLRRQVSSRTCRRIRSSSSGISHVPEGRMVFANLTVEENLRWAPTCNGQNGHPARDRIMSSAFFPA